MRVHSHSEGPVHIEDDATQQRTLCWLLCHPRARLPTLRERVLRARARGESLTNSPFSTRQTLSLAAARSSGLSPPSASMLKSDSVDAMAACARFAMGLAARETRALAERRAARRLSCVAKAIPTTRTTGVRSARA